MLESAPRSLILVSDDLIFPSRVREALRELPWTVRVVGAETALLTALANGAPAVILVNLNARRYDPLVVIAGLKAHPEARRIPILAFAGHVEAGKHAAARAAGADQVAANSSIALHLPAVLDRLLGAQRPDDALIDLAQETVDAR
jgi:CheY-like chemotaxis protein